MPPNKLDAWTEREIEILKARWSDGLSASEIALELRRFTRNAVLGKVHRLGLSNMERPEKPKPERRPRRGTRPRVNIARIAAIVVRAAPKIERSAVWNALPDSAPRPFWERGRDMCAWPIGDGSLSCCEPVVLRGYCGAHARVAYVLPDPKAKAAA